MKTFTVIDTFPLHRFLQVEDAYQTEVFVFCLKGIDEIKAGDKVTLAEQKPAIFATSANKVDSNG